MSGEENTMNPIVAKWKQFNQWLTNAVGVSGKKALFSFLALCIVYSFFAFILREKDIFMTAKNTANLLQQVVTYSIIGYGLTFCLVCGGTDLSAGASMCLVGMVVLSALLKGVSLPVVFLIAIVFGILIGIFNGFTIEILGVVPFIATLGTQWVFRGIAGIITNGMPIYTVDIQDEGLRKSFELLGSGRLKDFIGLSNYGGGSGVANFFLNIPFSVYFTAAFGILAYFVLAKTKVGRQVYACGSNLEAAKLSGINAVGTRMFAYCMSGISAAVCGILVSSRLQSAQPTAGMGVELEAIAAAVVGGVTINGGQGTIINTIIGSLIMGVLKNGLNLANVNSYYQQVIIGVILVVACALEVYRDKKSKGKK